MANDYTTSTDAFADINEGTYSSSDYPAMATFVTVASRLIDRAFGRWDGFFYPTTDGVDWFYDGSGESEQEIDEFASITAVAVSQQGSQSSSDFTSWTLTTDYLTKPYNATGYGRPINRLVLNEYNNTKGTWYPYQRNVKVSGIPGYSTTPPDIIVQATKIQAIRWFMRAKQGYTDTGASQNNETGSLTFKELDPDIMLLLKPLMLELS